MMTKHSIESKQNRPASTELQRLAQKENYALFQLAGMKGNAGSLMHTDSEVPAAILVTIIEACNRGIRQIKAEQYYRKQERKDDKAAKELIK